MRGAMPLFTLVGDAARTISMRRAPFFQRWRIPWTNWPAGKRNQFLSARGPAAATSRGVLVFRALAGLRPVSTRVSARACLPRELRAVAKLRELAEAAPRLSLAAHCA